MLIQKPIHLFQKYALPYWKSLSFLAFFVIAHSILSLINPHIVKFFIDTAVGGGAFSKLLQAAVLFFTIALFTQLFTICSTFVGKKVSWKSTNILRTDLVSHCLKLKIQDHHKQNPGDLTERIDGDVTALSNFFSNFFVTILNNVLILLGILIVFYVEDWKIGVLFTAFTFAVFLIINKFRGYAAPHFMKARKIAEETYGFTEEKINGLISIQKSGATAHMMNKLNVLLKNKLLTERKALMTATASHSITMLTFSLGTVLALGMGTYLFMKGTITIGSIYLIYTYSQMLRVPIEQISLQFEDLQRSSASMERIISLLSTKTETTKGEKSNFCHQAPTIEFKNITFAYEQNQNILHNLSFKVKSGEVLAIIGRTGCGKSTIARLLTRLFEHQQGDIFINGNKIQSYSIASIRNNVAYVTQELELIHGTIRENIALWDEKITDEQIKTAFKQLTIWEWFERQPKGLDTPLDKNTLSAGEAQLIGLTRVFLKKPQVIILDEATANLDIATEKLVMEALKKLLNGRTAFIIAHRLKTLYYADSIMMLEEGKLLEQGLRENLEKNPLSHYNQLLSKGMEEQLA
ncbi:ATP-binding cassette subfamily B protein/ATP-binding cassette subfamily C protein [Salirhabdus euzebyi]|uniref:ATP-binding cassette subfamily B protein/ATP-binding cassette subfamily C protein n=1 Tax=Salirhabdus euzebyi TaxID=394506 RepID=A0A841Q4R4_9BACI|nr:ABC transporter ATP-binding protein [Salirhabdus euzebyi]MBB6453384.1 ATP-binding cassette subfamily B protein/ATP-binding cassette subfamily C protein [Salirhabdus euzebyi]